VRPRNSSSSETAALEDAFISYLEEASRDGKEKKDAQPAAAPAKKADAPQPAALVQTKGPHPSRRFDPGRLWAYARREAMELLRDPIRPMMQVCIIIGFATAGSTCVRPMVVIAQPSRL
jgi:hypothetical protein